MVQNNRLHLWMFFKFVSTFFHLVGTVFHLAETFFSVVKEKKRRRNFFPFLFGVFYNFTTYNDFLLLNQWRRPREPKTKQKLFQNWSTNQIINIQNYGYLSLQNLKRKILNITQPEFQWMLLLTFVVFNYMVRDICLCFNKILASFLYLSGLESNRVLIPVLLKYINLNNKPGKEKVKVWLNKNYLNLWSCMKSVAKTCSKHLQNSKHLFHFILAKLLVSTSSGIHKSLAFYILVCINFVISGSEESTPETGVPRFRTEPKIIASGNNAGKEKWVSSLVIPPYTFKRKVDNKVGGTVTFSCNGCESCDVWTYAKAIKTGIDENGKPSYELKSTPTVHACAPSEVLDIATQFTAKVKEKIKENCLRSVALAYEETKAEMTKGMNKVQRNAFHAETGSFAGSHGNLYRFRNQLIPNDTTGDIHAFNTNSDWFLLEDCKESIVKLDYTAGNRRIIVFTTDKNLELLANCDGLSVDGTFATTPRDWYQTLIVCGEVSPGEWYPLVYAFCPDKTQDTYEKVFGTITYRIQELGLSLAASYIICDFEVS